MNSLDSQAPAMVDNESCFKFRPQGLSVEKKKKGNPQGWALFTMFLRKICAVCTIVSAISSDQRMHSMKVVPEKKKTACLFGSRRQQLVETTFFKNMCPLTLEQFKISCYILLPHTSTPQRSLSLLHEDEWWPVASQKARVRLGGGPGKLKIRKG